MRKLVLAFVVLTVGAVSHVVWASGSDDDSTMANDNNVPVRRGGVDGRPYWNAHSIMFMYPPAFEFKRIDGGMKYRFDVTDDIHETVTFMADSSDADLSPVWAKQVATAVTCGASSAGISSAWPPRSRTENDRGMPPNPRLDGKRAAGEMCRGRRRGW